MARSRFDDQLDACSDESQSEERSTRHRFSVKR
jgi:hypothetical protein